MANFFMAELAPSGGGLHQSQSKSGNNRYARSRCRINCADLERVDFIMCCK